MSTTTPSLADVPGRQDTEQQLDNRWVDLEPPLRNSDRLIAVFSQCRWDGCITFSILREFDRFGRKGGIETKVTTFIPEHLTESYLGLTKLAAEHIEKLKQQRAEGKLPFPEGGIERPRRR